jgi:sulfate/thiosulfate transport system substrate-binding protein
MMRCERPVLATIRLLGLAALITLANGCQNKPAEPKQKGDKAPVAATSLEAIEILNVSYDPTREFYKEFNQAFATHWTEKTEQKVNVKMSHGGSGKQARSVIDGLAADVVTLALAYDVDAIRQKTKPSLLPNDWQKKLPQNSAPYTSTIVFLVRKGNPKGIKDWNDLIKPDVAIITPNPKTSGGARWNYLAAWGYALKHELGDLAKLKDPANAQAVANAQEKARDFVKQLFARVTVLDSGARGATMTFVQRGMGDVLLAWENEAFLSVRELGPDKFEIVVPSVTILAEPTVAVIEKNVEKHDTRRVAEDYLKYLYSPEGQSLAAKHYYRPRNTDAVPAEYLKRFSKTELFTIDEVFGGWEKAQPEHFDDGGVFDQISKR